MHVYVSLVCVFIILMGWCVGPKSPNGTIKHLAKFSRYSIYVSNSQWNGFPVGLSFLIPIVLGITFLLR